MDEKIKRFQQLSSQIDELYYNGKDEDGEKLLNVALKQSLENIAYRLFFEGELAGYKDKDYVKQEALFHKASDISPDDHFLLRNVGTSLHMQGKNDEAIEWFKKALVSNDQDFQALGNIGVSLSEQRKEDEAIKWFEKALAINDKDFLAIRNMAFSEYHRKNPKVGFEKIKKAYELSPTAKNMLRDLTFFCIFLDLDVNEVIKDIRKGVELPTREKGVTELEALVASVQVNFQDRIEDFLEQKREAEKRLEDFLKAASDLRKDISFFLHLRKWNSFTPTIPSWDEERSIGGGYFICHAGKGTVIDPGYNFLENFYKAGCRVVDIDNVIITHAHNDHTNDFESIMTMLHQYNSHNNFKPSDIKYKKINVYMNTGSFLKFSGLLDLRMCPYLNNVYTMTPDIQFKLDAGMTLTVLPAYHDELVTKKYAVGLHFSIKIKEDERRILFTSDTSLFPQNDQNMADKSRPEIHERYGDFKKEINLLVPHLGSIKDNEIKSPINSENVFYPNHLGILGVARMITVIKPKLAVISEFGEELKGFRRELIDLLSGVVKGYFREDMDVPVVLPGDLPFIYNIGEESIYCVMSESMVSFEKMKYGKHDRSNNFYYYSRENDSNVGKLKGYCQSFETKRNGKICSSYIK